MMSGEDETQCWIVYYRCDEPECFIIKKNKLLFSSMHISTHKLRKVIQKVAAPWALIKKASINITET